MKDNSDAHDNPLKNYSKHFMNCNFNRLADDLL